MGLLRIAAAGALGYFAYRSWQRRSSEPALDHDASDASGHPLVTDVSDDVNRASPADTTSPGTSAH